MIPAKAGDARLVPPICAQPVPSAVLRTGTPVPGSAIIETSGWLRPVKFTPLFVWNIGLAY